MPRAVVSKKAQKLKKRETVYGYLVSQQKRLRRKFGAPVRLFNFKIKKKKLTGAKDFLDPFRTRAARRAEYFRRNLNRREVKSPRQLMYFRREDKLLRSPRARKIPRALCLAKINAAFFRAFGSDLYDLIKDMNKIRKNPLKEHYVCRGPELATKRGRFRPVLKD
jgi:hypothetical protein